MTNISQSKKIAVAAIAIFLISFSMLLFFLKDFEPKGSTAHTDVLNATSNHQEAVVEEVVEEELPVYLEHLHEDHADELDAPIFVTNSEGEIEYANEYFCKLINSKCDSVKGNIIFDYVNTKDISDLAAAHGKLVHDGEETDGLGPFRMLKGKTEILLLFTAEPLIGDDDKVAHIIYKVKDITEKVNELNDTKTNVEAEAEDSEELETPIIEDDELWIEHLYPKIDELKDDAERLMVNKTA